MSKETWIELNKERKKGHCEREDQMYCGWILLVE